MSEPHRKGQRFVRDVLVNVAANLVSAAIFYLGAVVGGFIAGNRILTLIAVMVIGAVGYAVLATVIEGRGFKSDRAADVVSVLLVIGHWIVATSIVLVIILIERGILR